MLDDLPDPQVLSGLWPAGSTGRTLITTRRRDAVLSESGRRMLDLRVFEPDEALGYLSERLSLTSARADVLDSAATLVRLLGALPLAPGQAAAVILDEGWTCAHYVKNFQRQSVTLRDLFPPGTNQRNRTVATTWTLAADAAEPQAPSGWARPLLLLLAVLDPNGIPADLLTSGAVQNYLSGYDESLLHRTLRILHTFSLITHDPADPLRAVRMHSLAQRATRETASDNDLDAAVTTAADALMQIWPRIERDPETAAGL